LRITRHITRPTKFIATLLSTEMPTELLKTRSLAPAMLKYNSPFVVEEPFPVFRWMTPVSQPNLPEPYCGFSLCASAQIKPKHRIVLVVPKGKKNKRTNRINHSQSFHPFRRCIRQLIGRLKQLTNFLPIWLAQCDAAQPMSKRKRFPKRPSIHPSAERQLTISQKKKTKKKREKKRCEAKRKSQDCDDLTTPPQNHSKRSPPRPRVRRGSWPSTLRWPGVPEKLKPRR